MNTSCWPHSNIKQVFKDVFIVTGTNKTFYNGVELQHSRNMIIVRENDKLSLINTVRLNDESIAAINNLGKVQNVIRLGAFHGRDDAFYLDHYNAKLWALKGMSHENDRLTDVVLTPDGVMPFSNCLLFIFQTSKHPEGILLLEREGGILITCDSIKNWISPDEYFSAETAALYKQQGFFGAASISSIWLNACNVTAEDFNRLRSLKFKHLLSAHGEPLLDHADEHVNATLERMF